MNKVLYVRNFLSLEECNQLNKWVELGVQNKWLDLGRSKEAIWVYNKRLTTRAYADRFNYPKIVYSVFNKITNYLKVEHLDKSIAGGGKDGVVVSYTLPGGNVYAHKDPMENDRHVLRCNVMTQAAEDGAELFIGGEKINIEVGDLHCYLPSNIEHYVTEAKGNTPRIMWMFGYQIDKHEFDELLMNKPE